MIKRMNHNVMFTIAALAIAAMAVTGYAWEKSKWKVHDMERPVPAVVTPGATNAEPPSDAIVLFDGKNLDQWVGNKNKPAQWKVENGYMEVTKTGAIRTKKSFGSCQLHIEWASPKEVKGSSQGRGNSGVFLMGKYETQVLDSYNNRTYADGQAGSVYGQNPPLVNAARKPGEWQTYDIIFHRPIFKDGKCIKPATITTFHNGVLVQDNFQIWGPTTHKRVAKYGAPHPDKLPISLQDHGNPTRFRNIWIRELAD